MGIRETLEEDIFKAGRILRGGWGEKIAIGILIGYLEPITPQQVYEYISSQKDLFDNLPDEEWAHYRELAENASLSNIDTARVESELNKRRNDLFQIITNTPGGLEWLDKQTTRLREKLGLLTN